jgi:hypothetical protein
MKQSLFQFHSPDNFAGALFFNAFDEGLKTDIFPANMSLLTFAILSISLLGYPLGFQEGDWVTFTNFRFVTSAATDQNVVYFGTTNGVTRYDRFTKRWLDPMTATDGLPSSYIENVGYDPSDGRLYAQTRLGAVYYQPTFRQWYSTAEFPLELARNDFNPGSLGILITEFGYTYQTGRLTDMNFRSFQLTGGVDDGFDHLFVGAWGLGTVVINPRYGELKRNPFGLYTEDASAIVRIDGKFWIGARLDESGEPGITLCDTSMQKWQYYVPQYTTGIGSTRISSALGDGRYTWLGTDYGLMRYDSDGETFTTYADFSPLPSVVVTSLAADSAWVYVGTDRGLGFLNRVHPERALKKKKKDDEDSSTLELEAGTPLTGKNRMLGWYVNCLIPIDNYLYVGTDHGALRRVINTYGDFEFINTPEEMLSDDILDIAKQGDSLFFATKNDIVIINTKTGTATTLTDPGQFGSWRIRKIAVDGGNLWAATTAGLWKCRLSDGYSRLFTRADGMISDDVRSIEMVGDYIWMATPRGVIRFFWNRAGRID